MILLNPFILLLLPIIIYIFKENFINIQSSYAKQTRQLTVALILLILALSRPVLHKQSSQEKFYANEYIIAIDASFSMNADDFKPSRYEVAKESIISLLKRDARNRYALFAFTSKPLLLCPPTTDKAILINALDALNPKYILTKGTSLMALLQTISALPQIKKNLIIWSDGGNETDLQALLKIANKSAISINIVAVASKKGILLKSADGLLQDANSQLILSRINPILAELAHKSNGFYLEYDKDIQDFASTIHALLQNNFNKEKKLQTSIISYQELYYYPLVLACIIILLGITKLQNYLPLFSLAFILHTQQLHASIFDFYYLHKANNEYINKNFLLSAHYYSQLKPSQKSYINSANAYYKAGNFQEAMRYYSKISSKKSKLKQIIFYNMGNCAVKLRKFQRAKNYYQKALAFGFDADAYSNLLLLYKLDLEKKVDISDMLPKTKAQKKKNSSQKSKNEKNENENENKKKDSKKSNTKQKSFLKKQGASNNKLKEKKSSQKSYQLGYKAYELINKGYTNEKQAW